MIRLNSAQVGISLMLPVNGVCSLPLSKLLTISARPKNPIAMGIIPVPSAKNGKPMVYRIMPEFTSVPTMPSNTPIQTIPSPPSKLPVVIKLTQTNPNSINMTYSAGPNKKAISPSTGAKPATTTAATVPPIKLLTPAVNKAKPVLPFKCI